MAHPNRRKFLVLTLGSGSTVLLGCGDSSIGEPFGMSSGGLPDDDDRPADDDDAPAEDDDQSSTDAPADDDDDNNSTNASTSGSSTGPDEDESDTADETSTGEVDWMCDDPFEGGTMLGTFGFVGEGSSYIGQKSGNGRDARLAFDLSSLTGDNQIVSNDDFFIRTEMPNQIDTSQPWSIAVDGLAESSSISLADLASMEQKTEVVVLECSGNGDFSHYGLLSAAEFSGVPLSAVFDTLSIDAAATRVLINGFDATSYTSTHSTPGASWIFTFEDLMNAGAFLATHMNGQPLPPDHGEPVRLVIPGWYGCCNIKWVDRITFVDEGAAATSQMQEFSSRTHQNGTPSMARDYRPAIMQQAAMPVRIEKWDVGGETVYKILGILWGGTETTDALAMRIDGGAPQPVEVCPPHLQNSSWTLWQYAWRSNGAGNYRIDMEITDGSVPTNRLDSGFYSRTINVDA